MAIKRPRLEPNRLQDVEHRAYETRVNNTDELKQRSQQNIVDAAIGECKKRLQARVRTQVRHFEHLL